MPTSDRRPDRLTATPVALLSLSCLMLLMTSAAVAAPSFDGVIVGRDNHDGRLLLGELNCTACHTADGSSLNPKSAPRLNDAGARVTPQYLRKFLADPHGTKPGTTMPYLLESVPARDRAATVDALVHYLVSLHGPIDQRSSGSSEFQIQRGKELYHSVGCVACHEPFQPPPKLETDTTDPDALEAAADPALKSPSYPSVPLGDLAMKTTVDALAEFLADPLRVRPAGRMPSMKLKAGEARMIAAYLLRDQLDKNATGWGTGLDFAYYEGQFQKVPDFETLKPKLNGAAKNFDLSAVKLDGGKSPSSNFAVRFRGAIDIPADGTYKFFCHSDDGTVLRIDDKVVVDHDGMHPPSEKAGQVELSKGRHMVELGFVQGGGGYELRVAWQRPGGNKEPVPPGILLHGANAMIPKGLVDFQVDDVKAQAGAKLFVSLGCAACHAVDDSGLKPPSAPALAKLRPSTQQGCLRADGSRGTPRYALDDRQRDALAASLAELQQHPDTQPNPAVAAHRAMNTLNCYACHRRGEIGGPDRFRARFFTTLSPVDMGDEGRLPPKLDDAGAKFSPQGLAEVMIEGHTIRPYIAARMPQFGAAHVEPLIASLLAADREQLAARKPAFSPRMVDDGRRLVGRNGLGCINCHSWGGKKIQGAAGLDLIPTTKRLSPAWFHAYLSDPQRLRPGTRMPTSWPEGKTYFPDIQGGDVDQQIDAVWAYLSVGEKGGMPSGLAPDDRFLLVPGDTPITFRTFLNGVGAHAITVGFQQRTHCAFDALRVRMALAWSGDFISAKPAWDGRAGQYAQISAADVVRFPEGSPFAVLDNSSAAWPLIDMKIKAAPAGWRFRGYRLDKGRVPTFLYNYNEIQIEETPATEYRDVSLLIRSFRLRSPRPVNGLYLRAAVGAQIEAAKDSFVADGKQRYRVTAPDPPIIREAEGRQELLVPVTFSKRNGNQLETEITVEITW